MSDDTIHQEKMAISWLIEHKSCSGFAACWAVAPKAVRAAILAVWGEDPWKGPRND